MRNTVGHLGEESKTRKRRNQGGSGMSKHRKNGRKTEISWLPVSISPFKPQKYTACEINPLAPNTSENTK